MDGRQSGRLDGAHVPAAPLHVQDVEFGAGDVARPVLDRRVAPGRAARAAARNPEGASCTPAARGPPRRPRRRTVRRTRRPPARSTHSSSRVLPPRIRPVAAQDATLRSAPSQRAKQCSLWPYAPTCTPTRSDDAAMIAPAQRTAPSGSTTPGDRAIFNTNHQPTGSGHDNHGALMIADNLASPAVSLYVVRHTDYTAGEVVAERLRARFGSDREESVLGSCSDVASVAFAEATAIISTP